MKVDEFVETYARWWFAPETNIPGDVDNRRTYDAIEDLIHIYVESVPGMASVWYGEDCWTRVRSLGEYDARDDRRTNLNPKFVVRMKGRVEFRVVYDRESEVYRSRGPSGETEHGGSLLELLCKLAKEAGA